MKELSVFDIIGPCMIGPSSSHTAGALRIALLARKMVKGEIRRVTFTLYGSFSRTYHGHGTDRALVAGILGFQTEDARIKDSFSEAEKAGLNYEFVIDQETKMPHPNTVDILLESSINRALVRGESVGGGEAVITSINGVEVSFNGEYSTIVIEQKDERGVLAYITRCLSDYGVNIAFSKLFREERGKSAYTIIEADNEITEEMVRKLEQYPSIRSAVLIEV
ncbi:MAG: L-serine ammonia-lyase, iron-sulfur-dependent subunit beta [Lachnospiraceae bacterium]